MIKQLQPILLNILLKNSLLFNKAVIYFYFQSTHDYTDLVRIVMSKPH